MDIQTSQPKENCLFEFRIADCDNRASRRLAPLLADGAIRALPGGRYGITPEERARLIRQAARQRVARALAAPGPDFSGILMDICGFCKGLEQLEREQALPARSGKVALAYALRMLARHYGLSNLARGFRHGEVEAWRAFTAPRYERAEPPADPA